MKKQKFSFLVIGLLISLCSYAQKQFDFNIKLNNEVFKLNFHQNVVTSINSYRVIDKQRVAVLLNDQHRIVFYSTDKSLIEKTIEINSEAIDFNLFDKGMIVLYSDFIEVYNYEGKLVSKYFYQTDNEEMFIADDVFFSKKNIIVNTADGKSWRYNYKNEKFEINSKYWFIDENIYAKTSLVNKQAFNLSIIFKNNENYNIEVNLSALLTNKVLSVAKFLSVNGNIAYVDIEAVSEKESDLPCRYILMYDFKKQSIENFVKIPFVYASYIQQPFRKYADEMFYCMSTMEDLRFYKINKETKNIESEFGSEFKLHFNDYLESETQCGNVEWNNESSCKLGSNCVTRRQVMNNAYKFKDLTWTATTSNIKTTCGRINGAYYKTPTWVTVGGKTSVPYKWGGYTDWIDFVGLIKAKKYAGNYMTENSTVCSKPAYSNSSDDYVVGVDCSGLVSRCWELSYKYGTVGLPGISTDLGSATTASGFNSLQPGDVINYSDHHVRLFVSVNDNGTANFIEASSTDWRVSSRAFSRTSLTNYRCLRYNNIVDARLALAQAISLNSNNICKNGIFNVNFRIVNNGGESWTGKAQLWLIKPDESEEMIFESSTITLSAGQSSLNFYYYEQPFAYSVGNYKLEARVLNNITSCNYGRAYKVHSSSWENPKSFSVINCSKNAESNSHLDISSDKISIYPNPFSDYINITNNFDDEISVFIYDNSMKLLSESTIQSASSVNLNTNKLTSGVYYIIYKPLRTNDVYVVKVVK